MRRNRVVSGLLIMGVLAVGIPGALAKPIPNRVSVAPSYTFIADEDLRGVGVALSILGPAACVGRIPGFSYLGVPSYYLMADWAGLDDTSSVGVETGGRFSHEINRIRLRQRALVLAYGVGVFGYHISRYKTHYLVLCGDPACPSWERHTKKHDEKNLVGISPSVMAAIPLMARMMLFANLSMRLAFNDPELIMLLTIGLTATWGPMAR